jgi:hypothetical protein
MSYLIIFMLGAAVGGWLAFDWGWNAAVQFYRDRDVARANERAALDRK